MPQRMVITGYMIPPPLGRYIRYWYWYRTAVAVLSALVLTGLMFGLYTQQSACDAHFHSCMVNVSGQPEDTLFSKSSPGPQMLVGGIDAGSVKSIGYYPVPRSSY